MNDSFIITGQAVNTEDYSVNTKLTCDTQVCSGDQVCGRKTVMKPGSRGVGGYELADVELLGCVGNTCLIYIIFVSWYRIQ